MNKNGGARKKQGTIDNGKQKKKLVQLTYPQDGSEVKKSSRERTGHMEESIPGTSLEGGSGGDVAKHGILHAVRKKSNAPWEDQLRPPWTVSRGMWRVMQE